MRTDSRDRRDRHEPVAKSDVVEAILTVSDLLVAAPLQWVRSRGFTDVTPAILAVMVVLESEGTSLSHLQRMRGRSKQAISQVVEELRRRGYAEIRPNPDDGRSKLVVPTDRGIALREIGLEARCRLFEIVEHVLGKNASDLAGGFRALAEALSDQTRGSLAIPVR